MGNSPLLPTVKSDSTLVYNSILPFYENKNFELHAFEPCRLTYRNVLRPAYVCICSDLSEKKTVIDIIELRSPKGKKIINVIESINKQCLSNNFIVDNRLTIGTMNGPMIIQFQNEVSSQQINEALNNFQSNQGELAPLPPPRNASLQNKTQLVRPLNQTFIDPTTFHPTKLKPTAPPMEENDIKNRDLNLPKRLKTPAPKAPIKEDHVIELEVKFRQNTDNTKREYIPNINNIVISPVNKELKEEEEQNKKEAETPVLDKMIKRVIKTNRRASINLEELNETEIFYKSDLKNERILAKGGQGVVSFAKTKFYPKIAVKYFSRIQKYADYNKKEFLLLKSLRFPQIVQYYGILYDDESHRLTKKAPLGFVMEYMSGGSLHNIIHDRPALSYTGVEVLNWIRQASSGINFLHKHKVIHRDIKPANMLVNRTRTILKICDLGLSSDMEYANTADIGTFYYIAPEVLGQPLQNIKYDNKCDVYSLAISMWEMIHRSVPYSDKKRSFIGLLDEIRKNDLRPKIQLNICPTRLITIIEQSWNRDPAKRLTMENIFDFCINQLEKIPDSYDIYW